MERRSSLDGLRWRSIEWCIEPGPPPRPQWTCSGCGTLRCFASTGKFRVNAQKKRLTVWLIYSCAVCGRTKNLVVRDRVSYLLPTIVWCEDPAHDLRNREFLFPFASVVECPTGEMPEAIGPTLVVSAITGDQAFIQSLMASANVDRLNIGPIPTFRLSWDQPHEGNLFEHLYRQRAFQAHSAA